MAALGHEQVVLPCSLASPHSLPPTLGGTGPLQGCSYCWGAGPALWQFLLGLQDLTVTSSEKPSPISELAFSQPHSGRPVCCLSCFCVHVSLPPLSRGLSQFRPLTPGPPRTQAGMRHEEQHTSRLPGAPQNKGGAAQGGKSHYANTRH